MNSYETVRITDKELMTINHCGEKIVAKLENKDDVVFYHFDYDPNIPLKIIAYFGFFVVIDTKIFVSSVKKGFVNIELDEFTWMLKARYELLNKKVM